MDKQKDYASNFSADFKLKPINSALLIIDMQYASASRNSGLGELLKKEGREEAGKWRFDRIEGKILPNIKRLLNHFRENNLHIIYITLGSEKEDFSDLPAHVLPLAKATNNRKGSKTHNILDEIAPCAEEIIINKTTFCAFVSSNIDEVLKKLGIQYVICCGVSTNTCVESTARDAADSGYRCIIVEDACGGAAEKYHNASIENFARLFGRVSSTYDVIKELQEAR